MAPGLRSSGQTGRSSGRGGRGGGCSRLRTDPGAVRRCVRTRWRAGGMPVNCLLSVGMLSLIVRCALAAEGKHTLPLLAVTNIHAALCLGIQHIMSVYEIAYGCPVEKSLVLYVHINCA